MDWIEISPQEESEDLVNKEDDEQIDLSSCRPGGTDAFHTRDKEDATPLRKSNFGSPLDVEYGYGDRTKDQDRLHSHGGKLMSFTNQDRNRSFVPHRETRGHKNSTLSHSIPNQGNDEAFHGSFNFRSKVISQASKSTDQVEIRRYGQRNNDQTTADGTRGPRAYRFNKRSAPSPLSGNLGRLIRRDQYNKSDFQIEYEFAKFFMIKSLCEDDIHKSIKYNVWSSTAYGNKKLDAAYWDAKEVMKEKSSNCPIFLFFSVNCSGQFLGLAEMDGPVDFSKDMNFWQEEKWNGFFPVKWRIVKDIPNRHFQHITLENNDNRVVTYSRDTQEIGLPHGLKMLSIFRSYPMETSMLDDFEFYEKKERQMRSTRARRLSISRQEPNLDDHGSSMINLGAEVKRLSLSSKAT